MNENLPSLIRENLVARRSGQFQFLGNLVEVPSEFTTGNMAAVSELTLQALRDLELGVERHAVSPDAPGSLAGVNNLVVRHEFSAGPVVALVAHGDTRPPTGDWTLDPLTPTIRGGVFYGLGALSKADIAVYAHALAALRDAKPTLSGTVELHITFDGEADGQWGTKWLLDNRIVNPDYAVGSGLAYAIGTSSVGDLQLQVEIKNLAGHPSADPMEAASKILGSLYQLRTSYLDIHSEVPGIGSPSLIIGQIQGGERPDETPGRVTFTLDRRLIPDEHPAQVEAELTGRIAETASRLGGIVCRIRRLKLAPPMKPGAGTDKLAGVLERQAAAVMGSPVGAYGVPHASATQHYTAVGIPSVLYGAGPERYEDAHAGGPDECLALDDVRKATEVVALALGEFMTPAG
ncbi:MAG: M20/M25/M40 family metallo-hydrolase [Rhodospirillales bacterium]|nr:M20/M25/M40 family metallo-hydrolase [Rhodospirillales bacterium]